jgi:hypothetical protein
VLLATFDVPFDAEATVVAVDAAVEAGQVLIVANVVELPPLPLSLRMGYDQLEYTSEMEESLQAPVRLAASLGIRVERLRIKSPRPVEALLEVARERRPGLLVFGPDREHLSTRRYSRAARALRENAAFLVWLAG